MRLTHLYILPAKLTLASFLCLTENNTTAVGLSSTVCTDLRNYVEYT